MDKLIQYSYTMQSTNFSITVSIQMCNFSMNAALFRRFACRPAAFLVVWGGQTEREPPLADFKLHAARVRVCVGLLADRRVAAAVIKQPFLHVGVVGADMDKGVFLVKPYIGGLFLLRKPCSHKLSFLRPCYAIGAFRVFFLALDKAKQIALRGAGLDETAQKSCSPERS